MSSTRKPDPPTVIAFPAPAREGLTQTGAEDGIGLLVAAGVPHDHVAALGVRACAAAWIEALDGSLTSDQLRDALGEYLRTMDFPRWPLPADLLRCWSTVAAERARYAPAPPRPWTPRPPPGWARGGDR